MIGKFFKILFIIIFSFIILSCGIVVLYKYINPPFTPIMFIRSAVAITQGRNQQINRDWISYDAVSKNLIRAIIAAEDARYMTHNGIDWKAVEDSKNYNKRHKGRKKTWSKHNYYADC